MKIKVGNLSVTFTGHPPLTKGEEKAWGHCVNLGNGEVLVWLNPLTAVDDKWFETLLHELHHVFEAAVGKKLPHSLIKLLSMLMAAALIQSGLIDPGEIRRRYEQGVEPAQLWEGEKDE